MYAHAIDETEYYLKTEKWMMSDVYPIRDGDILLVEGNFLDAKGETALSFSSNYISMEYGSANTFGMFTRKMAFILPTVTNWEKRSA